MKKDGKIYVAGHLGLAGSALVRSLERHGFSKFLFRSIDNIFLKSSSGTNVRLVSSPRGSSLTEAFNNDPASRANFRRFFDPNISMIILISPLTRV